MSSPGFFLYGRDFRDGCLVLKEDEVGVYALFLTLLYETTNGRLRDDDAAIARAMGRRDVRVWRRIKAVLLSHGKLNLKDGWLSNPKADREIAKRGAVSTVRAEAGKSGGEASGRSRRDKSRNDTSREDQPDFRDTSAESSAEVSESAGAKSLKNGDGDEAFASLRARDSQALAFDNTTPGADAPGQIQIIEAEFEEVPRDELALLAALIGAAGPGLSKNHDALRQTLGVVERALRDGCSLELDVLPVLADRTRRRRKHRIVTFAYFAGAWLEARDARLNPTPLAPENDHERADEGESAADTPRKTRTRVARKAASVGGGRSTGGLVGAALRAQAARAGNDVDEPAAERLVA